MGRNMAVTSTPAAHATKLLPRVVSNGNPSREKETQIETQENNGQMSLVISHCTRETQANLAQVITRYLETLEQCKSRFLGKLLMSLLYPYCRHPIFD